MRGVYRGGVYLRNSPQLFPNVIGPVLMAVLAPRRRSPRMFNIKSIQIRMNRIHTLGSALENSYSTPFVRDRTSQTSIRAVQL